MNEIPTWPLGKNDTPATLTSLRSIARQHTRRRRLEALVVMLLSLGLAVLVVLVAALLANLLRRFVHDVVLRVTHNESISQLLATLSVLPSTGSAVALPCAARAAVTPNVSANTRRPRYAEVTLDEWSSPRAARQSGSPQRRGNGEKTGTPLHHAAAHAIAHPSNE